MAGVWRPESKMAGVWRPESKMARVWRPEQAPFFGERWWAIHLSSTWGAPKSEVLLTGTLEALKECLCLLELPSSTAWRTRKKAGVGVTGGGSRAKDGIQSVGVV